MGQHKSTRTEFPLPDEWEVESTACLIVPVPDDPQYIAQIVGLIDLLKMSKSFARDITATGAAIVSRTWQAALESRPIITKSCEDIDMSYDTRVKAGQPWITEASSDGGLTWHDSLIQPNWAGYLRTVAPPIASDSDIGDQAARVIQNLWEWIAQQIDDALADGRDRTQTVNQILGQLAPYGAGASIGAALGEAFDAFSALSGGDQDTYLTDCAYEELFDEMKDSLIGALSGGGLSWLDGLSDWLLNTFDAAGDALMIALNKTVALLGGSAAWNFAANGGAGGGGSGFGSTCPWTHDYDFSAGDTGTYDLFNLVPTGGVGLVYTALGDGDGRAQVLFDWAAFTDVSSVTIYGGMQTGGLDSYEFRIVLERVGYEGIVVDQHSGFTNPASSNWTGSQNANRLPLYITPYGGNLAAGFYISRIVIQGADNEPPY